MTVSPKASCPKTLGNIAKFIGMAWLVDGVHFCSALLGCIDNAVQRVEESFDSVY